MTLQWRLLTAAGLQPALTRVPCRPAGPAFQPMPKHPLPATARDAGCHEWNPTMWSIIILGWWAELFTIYVRSDVVTDLYYNVDVVSGCSIISQWEFIKLGDLHKSRFKLGFSRTSSKIRGATQITWTRIWTSSSRWTRSVDPKFKLRWCNRP